MNIAKKDPVVYCSCLDKSSTRHAFTLIELMVVLSVIAILAAILIPVVGGIRRTAHNSQCVSNLRNIHGAIMLYASDNDGDMPRPAEPNNPDGSTNFTRWVRNTKFVEYLPREERANGYLWEHPVFVCPSVENSVGLSGPDYLRVTYIATGAMMGGAGASLGNDRQASRRVHTVDDPANTPLLVESKLIIGDIHGNYSARWSEVDQDVGASIDDMDRMDFISHDGHMNVAFVDGSVRNYTPEEYEEMTREQWRGVPEQ